MEQPTKFAKKFHFQVYPMGLIQYYQITCQSVNQAIYIFIIMTIVFCILVSIKCIIVLYMYL